MSKGLEALEKICDIALCDCSTNELNRIANYKYIVEKELKRLEELEKAFHALSKDDEKAKKLLSKEIEKNRALEIIKEKEVNVCHLMNCDSAKEYSFAVSVGRELADYEFVLLKEVLQEPK